MEILIRNQIQPVEVVISLSIWETEILGSLLGRLNTESIREVLGIEGESVLPEQVFGITSEIFWALVKDSRVNVGEFNDAQGEEG